MPRLARERRRAPASDPTVTPAPPLPERPVELPAGLKPAEIPEPARVVPHQVLVRIVCPWCKVKARQRATNPKLARAYYECPSNCSPNTPDRTRTIFLVPIR